MNTRRLSEERYDNSDLYELECLKKRCAWFEICLSQGRYQEILRFLDSPEGISQSKRCKDIQNEIFDRFLWTIAENSLKFSREDMKTLSTIRGILLTSYLRHRRYNRIGVRDLIQKHIVAEKPLADFIKRPFTFVYEFQAGRPHQIPAAQGIQHYKEVLEKLKRTEAFYLHRKQMVFYRTLSSTQDMKRYALKDLEKITP